FRIPIRVKLDRGGRNLASISNLKMANQIVVADILVYPERLNAAYARNSFFDAISVCLSESSVVFHSLSVDRHSRTAKIVSALLKIPAINTPKWLPSPADRQNE